MLTIDQYLDLITTEHRSKPYFGAVLSTLLQGPTDQSNELLDFPNLFDLDLAVGEQLNAIGKWVGISRVVNTPLTGVYFSFDDALVGFDSGVWLGAGDNVNFATSLDDVGYRILIRAKIVSNHWDGTLPTFLTLMSVIFPDSLTNVFVLDNQDMSMTVGVAGVLPGAIPLALLKGGYLMPKPAGVKINYYITTNSGAPIFGFDIQNSYISGFDTGAWASIS